MQAAFGEGPDLPGGQRRNGQQEGAADRALGERQQDQGAGDEEGEEGEEGEGAQVTLTPEAAAAQQFEEKLARARELARDDPRVIANLIKEWMGSNEQR